VFNQSPQRAPTGGPKRRGLATARRHQISVPHRLGQTELRYSLPTGATNGTDRNMSSDQRHVQEVFEHASARQGMGDDNERRDLRAIALHPQHAGHLASDRELGRNHPWSPERLQGRQAEIDRIVYLRGVFRWFVPACAVGVPRGLTFN
jgi:hypothetical protein